MAPLASSTTAKKREEDPGIQRLRVGRHGERSVPSLGAPEDGLVTGGLAARAVGQDQHEVLGLAVERCPAAR